MGGPWSSWFESAETEVRVAEHNLAGGFAAASIFHAQQAMEKALKSACLKAGVSLPRMHDLVQLARLAGLKGGLVADCAWVNSFYVASRYPDVPGNPTAADARKAISAAKDLIEWTRKQLG